MSLSVVVAVDFVYREKQLLVRTKDLVEKALSDGYEVVIVHNSRGTKFDKNLSQWLEIKKNKNLLVVMSNAAQSLVNNSLMRNLGVKKSTNKNVLFLDVDIVWCGESVSFMLKNILPNKGFSVSPCLYSLRSKNIFKTYSSRMEFVESYFEYKHDEVSHVAMPSSIMMVSKKCFNAIGGFDESYNGHGYEDFDFLIRLGWYYNLVSFDKELLKDQPYMAPMLSSGFRAELAKLALDEIFKGVFFIHLSHSKNFNVHLKSRLLNSKRFKEKLELKLIDYEYKDALSPTMSLIKKYEESCHSDLSVDKYIRLFDPTPFYVRRKRERILLSCFNKLKRGLFNVF